MWRAERRPRAVRHELLDLRLSARQPSCLAGPASGEKFCHARKSGHVSQPMLWARGRDYGIARSSRAMTMKGQGLIGKPSIKPRNEAVLDIKWIRDNQDAFLKGLTDRGIEDPQATR